MNSFQLTVPGNLLLAGEYAVLEEGGLGVALAVEPRLRVTVTPSPRWELVGRWVGGGEQWLPGGGAPPTFAGLVFEKAAALLGGDSQTARLEIDSTGFFDAQGRKLGFGSSAAVAVGITAALTRWAGREAGADAHQVAVVAHRHAQGGAGSGYDVTVSWFGGLGVFCGGVAPSWRRLDTEVLPTLAVFSGPEAVKTVGSIGRYTDWKTRSGRGRDFLNQSNEAVLALARADRAGFAEAWKRCRQVGLDLGAAVGSDAKLTVPDGLPADTFVKALGAGNETGIAVVSGFVSRGLTPLTPSLEGLRWE